MNPFRPARLVVISAFALSMNAFGQPAGNIATNDLLITGSSLTLETRAVTTGIDIPTTVQTAFGGKTNDLAPAVPDLVAVGDLTGPGIAIPVELQTRPGHAFEIPALHQEGTYLLQNVRLMRGAAFVQPAVPSTAAITVANVLRTEVKVRQLTIDELRQRGITVDARNFDVFAV